MKTNDVKFPRGYNPKTQKQVGLFAAQLDDQLALLKKSVKDLTVKQLEWQPKTGMNTIGMLLAHLALVEVWWINVAPTEIAWGEEAIKMVQKGSGVKDDGMPMKPKDKHPSYLKGYSAMKYVGLLSKARRSVHRDLKTWTDQDLKKMFVLAKKRKFSRTWVVYHVLEHFASHFGQILLLKHLMRDAGVLKETKKK